ncbi:MAG TPA: hypothetical protein VN887_16025 [Candidatus Angelobacter sp.]|nr:hypothetical protein [Candidatus Angelobacter sp.]
MNDLSDALFTLSADSTVYLLITTAFGIAALLCFLVAIFQREAVKRELRENGCQSLRIWWRPLAYWAPCYTTPFRVVYRDASGLVHRACCCVYRSALDSPFGPRRVRWLKDEVA